MPTIQLELYCLNIRNFKLGHGRGSDIATNAWDQDYVIEFTPFSIIDKVNYKIKKIRGVMPPRIN